MSFANCSTSFACINGMCSKKILLVLVYRPPRQPVSTLINGISIIRSAWKGEWIILLGNFNMDQMLQENIYRLVSLNDIFNILQHSRH